MGRSEFKFAWLAWLFAACACIDLGVVELGPGVEVGTSGDEGKDAPPLCEGGASECCIDPDDEQVRMIRSARLGELRVSEVQANPSPSFPDARGEYLELVVTAKVEDYVDLNGLSLWSELDNFSSLQPKDYLGEDELPTCMKFEAGEIALAAAFPQLNIEGYTEEIDAYFQFYFNNNGGSFVLRGPEGELVVEMTPYAVEEGRSWSYDSELNTWCFAQTPYYEDNYGTPGQPNGTCVRTCLDGDELRPVVAPLPGQLLISEFMADPSGTDALKEYVELQVLGAAFDLNDVTLSNKMGSQFELVDDACLRVSPGEQVLLARSGDPTQNGMLPFVSFEFDLQVVNDDDSLTLRIGDTVLHEIDWAETEEGASTSLEPAAFGPGMMDADDGVDGWCYATQAWAGGDAGSPGMLNPGC